MLFGSRSTGKILRGDYDVAVYFGEEIDAYKLGLLAVELSRKFNIKLENLDLLVIDKAPVTIAVEALYGKPLYVKDEELFSN